MPKNILTHERVLGTNTKVASKEVEYDSLEEASQNLAKDLKDFLNELYGQEGRAEVKQILKAMNEEGFFDGSHLSISLPQFGVEAKIVEEIEKAEPQAEEPKETKGKVVSFKSAAEAKSVGEIAQETNEKVPEVNRFVEWFKGLPRFRVIAWAIWIYSVVWSIAVEPNWATRIGILVFMLLSFEHPKGYQRTKKVCAKVYAWLDKKVGE